MQMRARLSNDHGWRQNRHDHHKGRARILTSGRVSPQLNAHSPRLCRHPDLAVTVHNPRSMISRCGHPTRVPANRARASLRVTARNVPTTRSDDMRMTDTPPPAPENPDDQHLALITALMKIFATGRNDEDR
jgi:hypothetical protein